MTNQNTKYQYQNTTKDKIPIIPDCILKVKAGKKDVSG